MALRDFGLLVMVCLLWAANNIVSKFVVAHLGAPPLFYAAVRFAVVAAVVFPWLKPVPRPLWRLILVALTMGGGNFALVFIALKTASPSSVAIVSQVMAPFTTLLSYFMLGERIAPRRVVGITLTLAGAMAVMWDPHGFSISTGLTYVVAGAFLGSLGAVMMKQMDGVKPLTFQAWVGLSSVIALTPLSLIFEPHAVSKMLEIGWLFWVCVLFSGLIVSVVGHTLYYGLIQRYEANLISPLTLMTPLATIVMGVFITHDAFGARMAFGTAIALAGVMVIALRPSQVVALLLKLRSPAP